MKEQFQVGDIVEFMGARAVVDSTTETGPFPLLITVLEKGFRLSLTLDGRHSIWHTKPSLEFISRGEPKKIFKECISINGNIMGPLLDDDFKDYCGNCFKDKFKRFTGREFELEMADDK